MVTMLATPAKVSIYDDGAGDAPFNDPLGNLGLIKFDSTFQYLPILPARTIVTNVSIPATGGGSTGRQRTVVLGAHGQPGVPFVYGFLDGGIPLCGSVPVHQTSTTGNIIYWTLGVDSTNVFLAEWRSNNLSFPNIVTPRTVTVYISSKLAA